MAELNISNAAAKVINLSGGTVADAIDIKGGYFVSQFIETTEKGEEGKIPPHACVEGALCYCTVGTEEKPGNKFYQYKSGEWVEVLDVDLSNYKEPITVDGNPITIVDDKGSTSITGSSITTETDVFKIVDTSGNPVAQFGDEGLIVTDIRTPNIRHDKETQRLFITGADVSCDGDIFCNAGDVYAENVITSNITHNEEENLTIGNSSNNGYVNFVEDISVGSDAVIITASGDIEAAGGLYAGGDVNIGGDIYTDGGVDVSDNINFNSTPSGITANAFNAGEGETCKSAIGFDGHGCPSIISNSGYIQLYDASPNGNDGVLTLDDSPTYSIAMDHLDTACSEGWNKTNASNKTNTKMYLVGATTQISNQKTYSNSGCYIGTDNSLYSNNKKTAVEELTMPVTKKHFRQHSSEFREPLVNSNCKHFSLVDIYVKDDSGELHDVNMYMNFFGAIDIVWCYSDESLSHVSGIPSGAFPTEDRSGIRITGYINHINKTFTGTLQYQYFSAIKTKTWTNLPIQHYSTSIEQIYIDGAMVWWSVDTASTNISAD